MKEKGAVVAQPRRESATENPVQTATQVKDDGKDPHDAPISVMAWSNMDMVAWLQLYFSVQVVRKKYLGVFNMNYA